LTAGYQQYLSKPVIPSDVVEVAAGLAGRAAPTD
jgi:hypothetical protein